LDSYCNNKGIILVPGHKLKPIEYIMILNRGKPNNECIRGRLLAGDTIFETLEPLEPICCPAGRYRVELEYSPRFDRTLPELKGVPGRTEIKFHALNRAAESEGCIGVGLSGSDNYINHSKLAMEKLMELLKEVDTKNQSIWVEILNMEAI